MERNSMVVVTCSYMHPHHSCIVSHRESGQDLGKGRPEPWAGLCCPPDEAGVALGAFRRELEGGGGIFLYLGTQATPSSRGRRCPVALGHQDAEGVHIAGPGQLTSILGLWLKAWEV